MNFLEAVEQARKGKRLRLPDWMPGLFISEEDLAAPKIFAFYNEKNSKEWEIFGEKNEYKMEINE